MILICVFVLFVKFVDPYPSQRPADEAETRGWESKRGDGPGNPWKLSLKISFNINSSLRMWITSLLHNHQVRYRVEWAKFQERERKKEEEEREKERVAYAQIDWHDFVVVETVDFQPNEQGRWIPGNNNLNLLLCSTLQSTLQTVKWC